jgi:cytochrome c oxidase assembly protein subunit 15
MNKIKIALKILAGLSIVLIALGSYVRATGAGLACPDWPLCFGRAVPEFTYGVTQEVVHRYLAGAVILLTAYILFQGYQQRKSDQGSIFKFGTSILLLVIVQAVLGGLTVTMKLNPFIVTTHLALGTLFFQIVATYAFAGKGGSANRLEKPRYKNLVFATAILTFLQILIGGFVGASGASLACPGFPSCGIPYSSGAQVIQVAHRMLGFLLAGFLFATAVAASRLTGIERLIAFKPMVRVVVLIGLQLLVGWLNLYYKITPTITVIHIVLAQGILLHLLLVWRRLDLAAGRPGTGTSNLGSPKPTGEIRENLA